MSGRRNTALFLPTPVEPLTDANGQVSIAWRGWFGQIQRRWSRGEGDPPAITDPTKWPIAGSLYSRTDGTAAAGNLLFVVDATGQWHPLITADFAVFTGDPRAPTPLPGDNDTSIATTAFVTGAVSDAKVSPVFTGDPRAPTPPPGDNDNSIATTAFVSNAASALLVSPVFTGDPRAPTPSPGDNDASIATTAFVTGAVASEASARSSAVASEASARSSADAGLLPRPGSGVTWTAGAGAPGGAQPVGSLYSNVAGAVGSTLYVSRGGGSWLPVAGV